MVKLFKNIKNIITHPIKFVKHAHECLEYAPAGPGSLGFVIGMTAPIYPGLLAGAAIGFGLPMIGASALLAVPLAIAGGLVTTVTALINPKISFATLYPLTMGYTILSKNTYNGFTKKLEKQKMQPAHKQSIDNQDKSKLNKNLSEGFNGRDNNIVSNNNNPDNKVTKKQNHKLK